MRLLTYIIFATLLLIVMYTMFFTKKERWTVYYSYALPSEAFLDYDLIVFDRDNHPPLEPLDNGQRVLLGYVSFGEAEVNRKDYEAVKKLDVLISDVPQWQGGDFIDVRKPQWEEYMLHTIIPELIKRGFNGIMFDTMDNLLWLEDTYPSEYRGLRRASIHLMHTVHMYYPDLKIMVNRGFDILPRMAQDIDMVLAESIHTGWNTTENKAAFTPQKIQKDYINKIKAVQSKNPDIKIYTLDYWNMDETKTVKAIYKHQRSLGYIPHVTYIDLQSLHNEPK